MTTQQKDTLKEAMKWGAGWVMALYLVYMTIGRIAPAIESVSGQMLTHQMQTSELRTATDQLIIIMRASCVNAAKSDAQRARCLQ